MCVWKVVCEAPRYQITPHGPDSWLFFPWFSTSIHFYWLTGIPLCLLSVLCWEGSLSRDDVHGLHYTPLYWIFYLCLRPRHLPQWYNSSVPVGKPTPLRLLVLVRIYYAVYFLVPSCSASFLSFWSRSRAKNIPGALCLLSTVWKGCREGRHTLLTSEWSLQPHSVNSYQHRSPWNFSPTVFQTAKQMRMSPMLPTPYHKMHILISDLQ